MVSRVKHEVDLSRIKKKSKRPAEDKRKREHWTTENSERQAIASAVLGTES